MASKSFPYQNNFSTGEVSPRFEGRTDIQKYFSAIKRLINFLPFTQGGVTRRPGLRFGRNNFCDLQGRIIPFKFTRDVDSNFLIHLCDELLFITDDDGVEVAPQPLVLLCEQVVGSGTFQDSSTVTCARMECSGAQLLNYRASGGTPPYTWSLSYPAGRTPFGTLPTLTPSGLDDFILLVTAPANAGASATHAFNKLTCTTAIDINNCKADINEERFGCDGSSIAGPGLNNCGCSLGSCPNCCDGSPTFCDGISDPGPCNGCFITFSAEDQLRGSSPCGACGTPPAPGQAQCIPLDPYAAPHNQCPTTFPGRTGCNRCVDVRPCTTPVGVCNPCAAYDGVLLTLTDADLTSITIEMVVNL